MTRWPHHVKKKLRSLQTFSQKKEKKKWQFCFKMKFLQALPQTRKNNGPPTLSLQLFPGDFFLSSKSLKRTMKFCTYHVPKKKHTIVPLHPPRLFLIRFSSFPRGFCSFQSYLVWLTTPKIAQYSTLPSAAPKKSRCPEQQKIAQQ